MCCLQQINSDMLAYIYTCIQAADYMYVNIIILYTQFYMYIHTLYAVIASDYFRDNN